MDFFFFWLHLMTCGTSPTRDQTCTPCSGNMESQPLDHQGSLHADFLVAACGLLLSCGMQTLSCSMPTLSCSPRAGSSSPTRDRTRAPLHWEHGVLSTGPPGKSLSTCTLFSPNKHFTCFTTFHLFVGIHFTKLTGHRPCHWPLV